MKKDLQHLSVRYNDILMVGFTIELRIIAQNALHLSIVYKSTHFSSNVLKEDA